MDIPSKKEKVVKIYVFSSLSNLTLVLRDKAQKIKITAVFTMPRPRDKSVRNKNDRKKMATCRSYVFVRSDKKMRRKIEYCTLILQQVIFNLYRLHYRELQVYRNYNK